MRGISSLVLSFLQILALGASISQSIYCGVCLMVSSLSESSLVLSNIINQIGQTIGQKGNLAIQCASSQTWVCLKYQRFNVADWKFAFTHLNYSVGVTAKYSFIELVWWQNGIPHGVRNDQFYQCLMLPYFDPWTVPSFSQCCATKFTGLALTDGECLSYWGKQTDDIVIQEKAKDSLNDTLHLWNDAKYERKRRLFIAQNLTKCKHGILKSPIHPIDPALVDVAHAFWSFIGMMYM